MALCVTAGHLCFQSWDGDFVAAVKVTGAYRDHNTIRAD